MASCCRCKGPAETVWVSHHTPIAGNAFIALLGVTYSQRMELPACRGCARILRLEDRIPWLPTIVFFGLFLASEEFGVPSRGWIGPYLVWGFAGWFGGSILLLVWRARRHPLRHPGRQIDRLEMYRKAGGPEPPQPR